MRSRTPRRLGYALCGATLFVACGGPVASPDVARDVLDGASADVTTDATADAATDGAADAFDAVASDRALDTSPVDAGTDVVASDAPRTDSSPPPPPFGCAPLAPPTGRTVRVTPAQANELPTIVSMATSGTTIVLDNGTYRITATGEGSRRLNFRTPGVTMRSASNDATAVILDGEYLTQEIININASDVTLAHFTVMRAIDHPVHVYPPPGMTGIRNPVLYGMRLIDGGEQFLKVNDNGSNVWVDDGRVECSTFQMTDTGRGRVERTPGGCYTGGIDVHGGRGWVVRLNRFESIYCAGEGLAEHAIHFWVGSRDTLVENNTILNCARGVGFGLVQSGAARSYPDNPYPGVSFIGHYDGVIRNNVIFASIAFFDTGIELDQARGSRVYHNTVFTTATATGYFSPIDYRFANTVVDIRNNLVTRAVTRRDGAMGMVGSNRENVPASYFVNASGADLHLTSMAVDAIDRGVVLTGAGLDIDGDLHTVGAPDLGADELRR